MKRLFFVLSFLTCISVVISASTFVPHLFWVNGTAYPFPMNYSESDLQIIGKAKEVRDTLYVSRLKFGKPSKDRNAKEQLYKFEKGKLVYYQYHSFDDITTSKFFFGYEAGKIKKVISGDFTFIYNYDSEGRLNEVKLINSAGGRVDTWMIEYKSKTEFTIYAYYGEEGKLNNEYVYKNGLLIKESFYDTWPKIELSSITNYLYNAQRKLIKNVHQSKRGNSVTNYTYNQKGWDNNYTYSTDTKGNWIEKKEKTNNAGEEFFFAERAITYEQ